MIAARALLLGSGERDFYDMKCFFHWFLLLWQNVNRKAFLDGRDERP